MIPVEDHIITNLLFKYWGGDSKYNLDVSVGLTSRNQHNPVIAINILFLQFLGQGKDNKDIQISGLLKNKMVCTLILH